MILHRCHNKKNLQKSLYVHGPSSQPRQGGCPTSVPPGSPSGCHGDVVRTLDGITLVTCVHIYLGADSAPGYLCPPATVSVSFRFHSLCNTHSPLNCLERNIKWSSCSRLKPQSGPSPTPSSHRIQQQEENTLMCFLKERGC